MQNVVNSHQAEAWNGYEGEHWARHQERYDAVNAGANEPLLRAAAIQSGDRVLDIGCGSGQTTRLAARLAGNGHATGIDLSGPMLERTRTTAAAGGIDNVDFVQGDAQVYSFTEGEFDIAISRFGVMFFDDPVAAFANIGRALRPGGRLSFVSLGRTDEYNEMMIPFMAIAQLLPEPEPSFDDNGTSPDSLADPNRTREILGSAGFTEIQIEPLEIPMTFGSNAEDAAEFILGWGPVQYGFRQAGVTDLEPARTTVVEVLRPFERADGVQLLGSVWIVSARRPPR